MSNIFEDIMKPHIHTSADDWKNFSIDSMIREEDALLTALQKYYTYENEKTQAILSDIYYSFINGPFDNDLHSAYDSIPDKTEYPLRQKLHPSLLLAYESGYYHKDHPLPEGDDGSTAILELLSQELFPDNDPENTGMRKIFMACSSLYFAFLYTLQYFQETFVSEEYDSTAPWCPAFDVDFRELATWKGFTAWLSSMTGKQIQTPVIALKKELNGQGELGLAPIYSESRKELEGLFVDMSFFWSNNEYDPALTILARSIVKNAPYIHFYDGYTHGQDYLGKKSLLYKTIDRDAKLLLNALKKKNGLSEEDMVSTAWPCAYVEKETAESLEFLLSCPCFFAYIHAATIYPYSAKHIASNCSRPAWGTEQAEAFGWNVLNTARLMLKNELQKFSSLNIYFEPRLLWQPTPEGYRMAACQACQ